METLTYLLRLGKPMSAEATKYYQRSFEWIDGPDDPFFTITFKYRSRGEDCSLYFIADGETSLMSWTEALQKLLIIPPPSPPPRLEDQPLESLSREELIELCRLYQQRSVRPPLDSM